MWLSRGAQFLVQTIVISSPATFAVELKCSACYCEVEEAFTIRNKASRTCYHNQREVSRLYLIQYDLTCTLTVNAFCCGVCGRIWTLILKCLIVSQVSSKRLNSERENFIKGS